MKCKSCGQDVPEPKKTLEIPELGIRVDKEVTQIGVAFKDIKFEKGQRLLTLEESFWLINSKYAEELEMNLKMKNCFWIKQHYKKYENSYVAILDWGGRVRCNWEPWYSGDNVGHRGAYDIKIKRDDGKEEISVMTARKR